MVPTFLRHVVHNLYLIQIMDVQRSAVILFRYTGYHNQSITYKVHAGYNIYFNGNSNANTSTPLILQLVFLHLLCYGYHNITTLTAMVASIPTMWLALQVEFKIKACIYPRFNRVPILRKAGSSIAFGFLRIG